MSQTITDVQRPVQFEKLQLWVVKYRENQYLRQKNFGQLQLAWNFYNQYAPSK